MIYIVWRRSGILVPIVLLINAWIVGHWYTDHRIGNLPETGWICFYTAIIVLLHGLLVLPSRTVEAGTDGDAPQPNPRATLWSHHFFYIPVIFWALIFGAISAYCLLSGPSVPDKETQQAANDSTPAVVTRTVHLFNPTPDSMAYLLSSVGEDYYLEDTLAPNTLTTKELAPGSYVFGSFDMNNEGVLRIPADDILNDTVRCKTVTNDKGKTYHERVLRPATASDDDFDDAWILTDGSYRMTLIDVSSLCKKNRTKAEVESTDWMHRLTESFDGTDFIEPQYGKAPAAGRKVTVLDSSDDIPDHLQSGEKVYLLLAVTPGTELSNAYWSKRLLNYCPDLQAQ